MDDQGLLRYPVPSLYADDHELREKHDYVKKCNE